VGAVEAVVAVVVVVAAVAEVAEVAAEANSGGDGGAGANCCMHADDAEVAVVVEVVEVVWEGVAQEVGRGAVGVDQVQGQWKECKEPIVARVLRNVCSPPVPRRCDRGQSRTSTGRTRPSTR